MPRWLVPVALVLVLVLSTWQGLSRSSGGDGRASSQPLTTPILSARRLPAALASMVASQRLGTQLQAVLAHAAGTQTCVEVAVGGSPVYAESPTQALLPASNIKLLTAYAAVTRMGRDAHLTTAIVADAKPNRGVVDGPLYLVGGGDPLLATAALRPSQTDWTESVEPVTSLETLADRIKAAGVTTVRGGIVGDDSRFDAERTVPSWKASYVSSGQVSPVSALEVDSGLRISGTRHTAVADPAASAAATLAGLLVARGVAVEGPTRTGHAPANPAPVAAIDSLPIGALVGVMLRESDNLAAEMLTKELGARFGGGGTWAAGLQVVKDALTAGGIPLDGLVQVDGSGLDRGDRVSCRTLIAVLGAPAAAELNGGMPTAGSCGTLVKRFRNTPAAGRIRAKTGSLAGVAALSGYVTDGAAGAAAACPPAGPPPADVVAFSLLVNGVASTTAATAVEDAVAVALASFPQLPILTPLEPQP